MGQKQKASLGNHASSGLEAKLPPGRQAATPEFVATASRAEAAVEQSTAVGKAVGDRESVHTAEMIRQADHLKAQLLGAVSQELRSPLAVIKGYANTLLRYENNLEQGERREFLEAIGEACTRLEVMVNHLLAMSQLETGMLTPRLVPVSLERLVREAGIRLEEHPGKGGSGAPHIVLQVEDGGQIPLVQGDHRLLGTALDIVLDNALKYSLPGSRIEVALQVARLADLPAARRGRADSFVVISVQNSGIGVPAAHLERIIERFHWVDSRHTREDSGLGLGLAICKRIVELHGGVIWGHSELREGCTFFVALPMAVVDEVLPAASASN
jgi:two-component system phosphate regulon sensor histidine kinase PhoR